MPGVSEEVATALSKFFTHTKGPSHLELDEVFSRSGLKEADPRKSPSDNVGKEIRVRGVLGFAARHPNAVKGDPVEDLLARMRVAGCFDPVSDQYGTDAVVRAAQRAFHLLGWRLGSDGTLAPIVLKTAEGPIRRPALESMIRRIQSSGEDGPLLVTEAKSLLEATAMYVLEETGFSCPATPDFNQVLYLARERIDLLPERVDASSEAGKLLRRVYEALWKLASAVNELRNREGIDHGRTDPPQLDGEAGRAVIQAAAPFSDLMLASLDRLRGSGKASAG